MVELSAVWSWWGRKTPLEKIYKIIRRDFWKGKIINFQCGGLARKSNLFLSVVMPGVPKSRGCNNCLRQKKKVQGPLFDIITNWHEQCDQQKPACSRCTRLEIPCVGSGERKYVFKPVSFTKLKHASLRKLRKNKDTRGKDSKDARNEQLNIETWNYSKDWLQG